MSLESSNYDPLPLNGIEKIRQRKLTPEEIEEERQKEEGAAFDRGKAEPKAGQDVFGGDLDPLDVILQLQMQVSPLKLTAKNLKL